MTRERDMPDGRWARIAVPTPNQRKHRLSGYERDFYPNGLNAWHRGLEFTWIWESMGREWYWYEQAWIFRDTRTYWMLYVPYFWRSGAEFFWFEERFIEEATKPRGTIPENEFIRRAEAYKTQLQLGAIQGPLLGGVAKGAGAAGALASMMGKVGEVEDYQNMIKCFGGEDGYERACASLAQSALMKAAARER